MKKEIPNRTKKRIADIDGIPVKIEIKDIDEIKFRDDNPREHSEENLQMIENSMMHLKAGRSILIDENDESLAGEGTTRGAKKAGIKKVIVIETDGSQLVAVRRPNLNETEKREMIWLDNRANETSGWNDQKTAAMLQALKGENVDFAFLGISDDEFDHFLANANFKEGDFDHFFREDDGTKEREKQTVSISFSFPKKDGEPINEFLSSFGSPETALKTLIELFRLLKEMIGSDQPIQPDHEVYQKLKEVLKRTCI